MTESEPPDPRIAFQKRAVIVLFGVFLLSLAWGLRQAGMIKFPSLQPAPAVSPAVTLASSLPGQVENFRVKTESVMNSTPPALPRTAPSVEKTFQPVYTATNLRNPLEEQLHDATREVASMPGEASKPQAPLQPPPLVLQGLVWGGPKPTAIIDNRVYGIGETIQGFTITDIGREGITVALNGQTARIAARRPEEMGPPLIPQARGR